MATSNHIRISTTLTDVIERRRRFSIEEKQAIVAAAFAPGAVVSNVARRADVCPSLIYRWRRELSASPGGFAEVILAVKRPNP